MKESPINVGFINAYSPQYKPIAEALFKSNLFAGILGIFPPANPIIINFPSQAKFL